MRQAESPILVAENGDEIIIKNRKKKSNVCSGMKVGFYYFWRVMIVFSM